ncbi:MAG: hypothetical protein SPD11_13295 [Sphaerochaetaceae bacterium]|nr:hypothetical protein [Sphaerochaetaceae bacterium]
MSYRKLFLSISILLLSATSLFAVEPIATIDGKSYFQHSSGRYYYRNPSDGTYYFTNDDAVIARLDAILTAAASSTDRTLDDTDSSRPSVVPVVSVETSAERSASSSVTDSSENAAASSSFVVTDEMVQAVMARLAQQGITPATLATDAMPPDAGASQPEKKSWWQSEVEEASFSYDLYFRTQMLRNATFSLGGGLNLGLQTASFKFEFYGLGDYYLAPLGGTGGAASLEFSIETGVMLAWKFMEVWRTRTYVCLDMGWYAQFAKIPQQPDDIFMGFNGIMFRPKIMTEIRISEHYAVSIGLFYQFPLYPAYSDYRCLGAMISFI